MKHKNKQRYSFSLNIQGSNIKNVYFDRKRMQQKQVEECILTSRMVQFCARILSVGRMCVLSFLKEDLSTAVVVTSIISNICIRKISTCISVSSRVFKLDKTVEVYRSKVQLCVVILVKYDQTEQQQRLCKNIKFTIFKIIKSI